MNKNIFILIIVILVVGLFYGYYTGKKNNKEMSAENKEKEITYLETKYDGARVYSNRVGTEEISVSLVEGGEFNQMVTFKNIPNFEKKQFVGYLGSGEYDANISPEKEITFVYSNDTKYCSFDNSYQNNICSDNIKGTNIFSDINQLGIVPVGGNGWTHSYRIEGSVLDISYEKIIINVDEIVLYTQ